MTKMLLLALVSVCEGFGYSNQAPSLVSETVVGMKTVVFDTFPNERN